VLAIFQQMGWPEILIILFLALLIFGAKRLPEIGRSLGKGIREFKGATKGLADDDKPELEDEVSDPTKGKPKEE
jgi:sec-independent protein translocase protein TatA